MADPLQKLRETLPPWNEGFTGDLPCGCCGLPYEPGDGDLPCGCKMCSLCLDRGHDEGHSCPLNRNEEERQTDAGSVAGAG